MKEYNNSKSKQKAGSTAIVGTVGKSNQKPGTKVTTGRRGDVVKKKGGGTPAKVAPVAPLNMVTLTQAEFDSILSTIGQLTKEKGIVFVQKEIIKAIIMIFVL